MRPLFVIVLLCLASSCLSVSDRRCGNNINFLWLDVVFVIDNSQKSSLNLVYDTISDLFSQKLQIGTGYADPRSTRVGFVTYNNNATDVADFYKLQSRTDLSNQIQSLRMTPQSTSQSSYLDSGLLAAQKMINSTGGFRDNYKKIIIVFTSVHGSYRQRSPKDISSDLKAKGVVVVTVNTGSSSDTQIWLKQIASNNTSFAIADRNATQEILQTMINTNCYCSQYSVQYMWPMGNTQNKYATCVDLQSLYINRDGARAFCHKHYNGGYLVNELDQQKRAFNFAYINSLSYNSINVFYNGLLNVNNGWYWDQPTNKTLLPLNPASGAPPTRSACVVDIKYSDGTTAWTPVSCGNNFLFICETIACDTDNYCEN